MTATIIIAATALSITAMLCLAGLRAWRGWLALKRLELDRSRSDETQGEADVGVRIELAAVRERLKRLEAIASGVEL
jgi:membrane protein implicated in regulation of membrane protease activity